LRVLFLFILIKHKNLHENFRRCLQNYGFLPDTDLSMTIRRILVIQTAFLGDAILATSVLENLHHAHPTAQLDFLVRKGHESLFASHPYLHNVLVWDKKKDRYRGLWSLLQKIRQQKYDQVITLQRFASTGLLAALSGARERVGFDKNPLSFAFTRKMPHQIQPGVHEIHRNQSLIAPLAESTVRKPRLYPTSADYEVMKKYQKTPYFCIAPASVWFTKQYPAEHWAELIRQLPPYHPVFILGSTADVELGNRVIQLAGLPLSPVNLCGKLSFLESAALMQKATMNYVNDSAPMHIASAMNAPVCAVYCSTVPSFGFGPLSDQSFVVETKEPLSCRPCGLHGYRACPEGHFRCALTIETQQLTDVLAK
jgi:lipopolysaccharide heptosyltransferase II